LLLSQADRIAASLRWSSAQHSEMVRRSTIHAETASLGLAVRISVVISVICDYRFRPMLQYPTLLRQSPASHGHYPQRIASGDSCLSEKYFDRKYARDLRCAEPTSMQKRQGKPGELFMRDKEYAESVPGKCGTSALGRCKQEGNRRPYCMEQGSQIGAASGAAQSKQ
jgi:hypothetical protein